MTAESNLEAHARRELILIGQFKEDAAFANSILAAVRGFASYGHSGGSAAVGIHMIHDLLQFKALSPLTTDPDEWMDVHEIGDGRIVWQSKRDPAVFCEEATPTNAYRLVNNGREPVELVAK